MFSDADILEIYRFLPPQKQPRSQSSGGFPLLIRSLSGQGFVTEHSLRREFERLVTEEPNRISIASASSRLGVEFDVVLQLVRENCLLALLDQDHGNIISRQERDAIVAELSSSLAKEPVNKSQFSGLYGIDRENLGSLILSTVKEDLEYDKEDVLIGTAYAKASSTVLREKLLKGLDEVGTLELKSHSFPGAPPMWLIRRQLDGLREIVADESDVVSQYHIKEEDDAIYCTPKKSVVNQRDQLLSELQAGTRFSLPLEDFLDTFKELYPSSEALKNHISSIRSITTVGNFAISKDRLSSCVDEARRVLDDQGYVDLKTIVPSESPHQIENEVRSCIIEPIIVVQSEGSETLRQHGDYWLGDGVYDNQRQAFLDLTKNQATRHWERLKEIPDKDPKFQLAELVTSIPDGDHLLRTLAQGKEFETAASEHFAVVISDLESQNEKEFGTFWAERVPLRVFNYTQGLKSVQDSKLQEQLSELLSAYLQKDFLPDVVSKARCQGLVCSKRTRKNVNRFEATLKTGKSDLSSVLSTVEKFSKKQGFPEVEADAAAEAKKALVQDMMRRMQKPKTDAPLMFLSLVIILFAKQSEGVVYATGKYAPKLLKQLRTQLSSEEYEKVDKWKESAKAGSLDKMDREAMVQMAE